MNPSNNLAASIFVALARRRWRDGSAPFPDIRKTDRPRQRPVVVHSLLCWVISLALARARSNAGRQEA